MALRYRVGGDTLAYMSSYSYIPTLDKLELQDLLYTISDPLYVLLCSISKSIHPSFYVFQIIHSIILNVSLSVFLMRYCILRCRCKGEKMQAHCGASLSLF